MKTKCQRNEYQLQKDSHQRRNLMSEFTISPLATSDSESA